MYTHVNMYIYIHILCTFIRIISYVNTYIHLLYIILPDKKASPFPFFPDLGSNDLWEGWIFPGLFSEHLEVSMKNPSFPSGKLTWNPKPQNGGIFLWKKGVIFRFQPFIFGGLFFLRINLWSDFFLSRQGFVDVFFPPKSIKEKCFSTDVF